MIMMEITACVVPKRILYKRLALIRENIDF